MQPLIAHFTAREILDSRGNPTVEATCHLTTGTKTVASVPSGASTGTHEAVELRDQNPAYYHGQGVTQAVNHLVSTLSPGLAGEDPVNQEKIDRLMLTLDGTPNKSRLGANAILAASMAVARAGALARHQPLYQHLADLAGNDQVLRLPVPFFNVLNGGLHAGMNLDFQEFIVVPRVQAFPDFPAQLSLGAELIQSLKIALPRLHQAVTVGDEGGFAPLLKSNRQAIDLILSAGKTLDPLFEDKVRLGFDFAANTYFKEGHFHLKDATKPLSVSAYVAYLKQILAAYHPYSFEDPFPENAWEDWTNFTKAHGSAVNLVGDDLLVTNPDRLKQAITCRACNAILIKPNQIGTVTETLAVISLAKKHHFLTVTSHRSGETTDDFIADLAVGAGTDHVKFGAPVRGERVAKYNRLLQIYQELN